MAFSKDLKVFGRLRRKLCMLLRASIAVPAPRKHSLSLCTTTYNTQTTYNIHASACTQELLAQTPHCVSQHTTYMTIIYHYM